MKEFDSLGAFARHLVRTAAMGEIVEHHAAMEAGKVIQHDAQDRIGTYQDGEGGFPAWANLAESTVMDRISKGFTPDDPLLRTGGMRDSIAVTGEGGHVIVGSDSEILLYQEQGTPKIPPRPVLGPAAFSKGEAIRRVIGLTAAAWVAGVGWRRPSLPEADKRTA